MKKLLGAVVVLAFLIGTSGCQPQETATERAQEEMPTPVTPIVLATPTPKPPPPTPTPMPPTPTKEATTSAAGVAAATPATPEPTTPPVSDVVVEIPAGPFTMGSDKGDPEDAPAHQVDLPAFEIDKFEVTNADFGVFVQATNYQTYAEQKGYQTWKDQAGAGKENHPVVMVTWDDAAAFCQWVGKRLPTEAEWEKAARGQDGRTFPWGNDWDPAKANVKETGLRGTAAVGSFGAGASPYGVEDMAGNVWEWTADWYQPYPKNTTPDDYYGEKFRVTRGGGWFDEEAQVRSFNRNAADPAKTANDDLGFRCAR
jgi:formylglycine-generating enzyme required for sulfatase activity